MGRVANRSKLKTQNSKKKVALGLSGGVDSAVSAALLLEKGYEVTGVYLECWPSSAQGSGRVKMSRGGCRADGDRKDALAVALQLGIPFKVLDFKDAYRDKVVEYFYREYEAGRTPNPDTVCNREIKFGLFYEWAIEEQGFDFVATGHYARIRRIREIRNSKSETLNNIKIINSNDENLASLDFSTPLRFARNDNAGRSVLMRGRDQKTDPSYAKASEGKQSYFLQRGKDAKKDQSYFLYQLRPEQLGHVLFPIGGMTKEEVRTEAKRRGLPVAEKPDSQGICFIGDVDVRSLLQQRIEKQYGDVVMRFSGGGRKIKDQTSKSKVTKKNEKREDFVSQNLLLQTPQDDRRIVGEHEGVWFYTVGQRLGKELDQGKIAKLCKAGVLDWDPRKLPSLYVVEKDVERNRLIIGVEDELMRNEFEVSELNWLVSDEILKHFGHAQCWQVQNDGIFNMWVRIRNLGEIVEARIMNHESGLKIITMSSLRGVAEGQACVFYSGDDQDAVVFGGGVIS